MLSKATPYHVLTGAHTGCPPGGPQAYYTVDYGVFTDTADGVECAGLVVKPSQIGQFRGTPDRGGSRNPEILREILGIPGIRYPI